MNNRDKRSILFFALGLSVAGVGVATDSYFLTSAGLFAIAVTIRYRKRPPFWDYLAFLVLALVIVALVPPSSPLIGAIPLMLSYVLDYIDEQRQKRVAHPAAALVAGATHAEPEWRPREAIWQFGSHRGAAIGELNRSTRANYEHT